jgi:hypothetical protein
MSPEPDQADTNNSGLEALNSSQGESLAELLPFMKDELEALSPVLAHQLGISFIDSIFEEESIAFTGSLQLSTDLVMEFPGLTGFGFAISIPDDESTGIYSTAYIELFPRQYFLLSDIALELRLPGSLFTPVTRLPDGGFEPLLDEQGEPVSISLQLRIGHTRPLSVAAAPGRNQR